MMYFSPALIVIDCPMEKSKAAMSARKMAAISRSTCHNNLRSTLSSI
ncbi:MAG: hypothetical protein ACOC7X_06585 [Spirochaetota bacterium]